MLPSFEAATKAEEGVRARRGNPGFAPVRGEDECSGEAGVGSGEPDTGVSDTSAGPSTAAGIECQR